MGRKVNWGIIAAGGIARRRTLPAMKDVPNAVITGIMDKNQKVLDEISEEYKITDIYTEGQELLNNPQIEAVYVASPVCFHKKQALEVLHAGKSLLLEKPLAMNEEDAREIVQTALKKGQTAGVAMVMKHHPAHRKMKKLIESGVIGDIVSCRAQLNCWFPDMEGNWRQKKATAGGGALVDMGTHCIDILKYLLDDHVEWVFGDIGTRTFSYEVDDSADCILHMKKGATCYIDVHFNIPDEAAKGMLEIYGTKGSLLASGTIGQDGQGEVYLNQCATEGYDSNQKRKEDGLGQKVDYERENIYGRQIEEFSKAIEEGLTVSTSFEDAFETVKIIDALYKSSKEKKAVYL